MSTCVRMSARVRGVLIALALASGALAAIAGSPQPRLAHEEIAAVDLAQRLRDAEPGLLVLDARRDAAVREERLPGALPLHEADAARVAAATLVVIYDDGDGLAADRARTAVGANARRLRGGLRAWHADVLFPVVRSDASARRRQEFETRAALSRYFGGTPRRLEPGETIDRARSRRGC